MFIEKITLQNIKSYGSSPTTIEFKEGVNLIAGVNGAGKSTILEAIGFVLFDTLPYSQSDFERRGKFGTTKITIRLQSAYDNRIYDVERTIPARYRIIDVQANIDEGIQSKEDLLKWLCQHLKVEGQEDLKPLFENAIGVQQGTMTATFLESPSGRKMTFDSLLRVQDFEAAWVVLGETKKYISELVSNNQNEIARKEGQTERLPELESSIQSTHADIADKNNEFEGLLAKLQILKTSLEQLDQQKQQLDTLNYQIEQVDKDVQYLQKSLTLVQDDFKKSQAAYEIVIENEESSWLYSEADERLKELEEQRKQRDRLIEDKLAIEQKIIITEVQIKRLEKDLTEVESAEAQVVQLEPLTCRQEELENEYTEILSKQKERNDLLEQSAIDEQKRESLEFSLQKLHEIISERKQIIQQVEQLIQQEESLRVKTEELITSRQLLEDVLESAKLALISADKRFGEYTRLQESIKQQQIALDGAEYERRQVSADLTKREEIERQVNDLDSQITWALGEKTTAESAVVRITKDLEELRQMRQMMGEESAICPVCRRAMDATAHAEAIDYYETQERKLNNELQQGQDTIIQMKDSSKKWRSEKTLLEKKRDALANQVALMGIDKKITDITGTIFDLQSSLSEMEDAPRLHAEAEIAQKDAISTLDQHNNHINELVANRTDKMQQIAHLNGQIANLPSPEDLRHREDEYNVLADKIAHNETRLCDLDSIDDDVRRLKTELENLDNPREKMVIAQSTAIKRKSLESEYQEKRDTLASEQSVLKAIQGKMQEYENLDDAMEAARKQRDETVVGYQLYIENKQTADLLNQREGQLAQIISELEEAEDKQASLVQQIDELSKYFAPEKYEFMKQEYSELETKRTKLSTQIENLKEHLSKKEEEEKKLRAILMQIQELQSIGERLKEELTTFEFVRKSVRDAGPRIRKRKVQLVSEIAANYFSEIINDFTMRLYWDANDYGIYLEQGGERRPFSVLSGGEQMIAALSVRLALLTHMTHIRLIFLDEPTINLDENRRTQLAERLSQIKGLRQLFVVSHDDTFIGQSNHVINITKEDGVSHVEMSHASIY